MMKPTLSFALMVLMTTILCTVNTQGQTLEYVIYSGIDQNTGTAAFGKYYVANDTAFTFLNTANSTTFTNDILLEGSIAWMTAGSVIYKYDLATNSLLDTLEVNGVHRLAVHNDKLVVAKWFPLDSLYIDIYDKNSLQLLYRDRNADNYPQDIVILGNKAYVGNVNNFSQPTTVGEIWVYDLVNDTFERTITLNTSVPKIGMLYGKGNFLYALGGSGLAVYDVTTDTFATYNISRNSTCFGFPDMGLVDNMIIYGNGSNTYDAFDINTRTQASYNTTNQCAQAGRAGENRELFIYDTDFVSSGTITRTDVNGVVLGSFNTIISGQAVEPYYTYQPSAVNDNYTISSFNSIDLAVLDNDNFDANENITISISKTSSIASAGQQIINQTTLRYFPAAGINAIDTFEYQICNQFGKCDTARVVVDYGTLSIDKIDLSTSIQVYPNPVVSITNLMLSERDFEEISYEISSMEGVKLVQEAVNHERTQIDMSQLPAGFYLLKVNADGNSMVKRLIKQ